MTGNEEWKARNDMNQVLNHALVGLTAVLASTALSAQTGSQTLDKGLNLLKRMEQLAASAPARKPAADAGADRDAQPRSTPSGSKLDLDSDAPQTSPGAPQRGSGDTAAPDLVDLKLGMSPQEAADVLAKRYPSAIRKAVKGRWDSPVKAEFVAGLVAIDAKRVEQKRVVHGEYLQLNFAPPPSRPVVVGVIRKVLFGPGQESNRDEWVKSLEEKYGRATLRKDHWNTDVAKSGQPVALLVWYFDKARPGDPNATKGPLSVRCETVESIRAGLNIASHYDDRVFAGLADGTSTSAFTGWMRQAEVGEAYHGFCGRSLRVNLIAKQSSESQPLSGSLLTGVDLSLIDHDTAAAAARKTNAMLAGAASKAATERVEQSKQNRPTL
jgi:hypothetical protein